MRLALVMATIITLCQLSTAYFVYDSWRMDKEFMEGIQGGPAEVVEEPEEEGGINV